MSGSAVLISGGTSETVEIFWLRAFSASVENRSSSLAREVGGDHRRLALAMFSKLRSAVCGLICCSIAFITHFWRAIRE